MIRCRVARTWIDEGLERELALERRFRLDEHTASCEACAAHEHRARSLQELLEGPGDPLPVRADTDAAVAAVLGALERGEGSPWRPAARRPLRIAGVGLLLAGAAAALLLLLRQPPTRVEAAVPELLPGEPVAAAWTPESVAHAVRAELVEHFGRRDADRSAAEAFAEGTRDLTLGSWPVQRFVQEALEAPEPEVARAAARCLGAMGGASATPALERALRRPAVAESALWALGAVGEPSVAALERALSDPGLASRALLQLCRVGGPRVASVLERRVLLSDRTSIPSREALLDGLTTVGPAAVPALMRMAEERERRGDRAGATAILVRLPLVADAGPALVEHLRARRPDQLAYRALAILRPPEALPWLEERCGSHRERANALETLATFPGPAPLASMLRLASSGRVPHDRIQVLFDGLVEREPRRALGFSRILARRGDARELRTWSEIVIESENPRAAAALVPLVFCDGLSDADRQWAALALGEFGTPDDARALADELEHQPLDDRRLVAACVLSIHALLGRDGVTRFLGTCSDAGKRRVFAALGPVDQPGEAVLVHRVARALEGALSERGAATKALEAIL